MSSFIRLSFRSSLLQQKKEMFVYTLYLVPFFLTASQASLAVQGTSDVKTFVKIRVSFKGQLISKCPFGVIKSYKKSTKFFPGCLSTLKGSNQKSSVRESK